jgi:hypothetical protein
LSSDEQELERLGLLVRPPSYTSGAYASLGLSEPSPVEEDLYPLRAKALLAAGRVSSSSVVKVLLELGESSGVSGEAADQLSSPELAAALKDYSHFQPPQGSPLLDVARLVKRSPLLLFCGSLSASSPDPCSLSLCLASSLSSLPPCLGFTGTAQ